MASYIDTLSPTQKSNVDFIIKRMAQKGITNAYMQAGILAVVAKESKFIPKSETSYANTSNQRIRLIFGSRVADLSEAELTATKADPVKFFDKVYGGRYGNAANEGYKYRGRGLNQITFKGNYQDVNSDTDVDIVADPDLLNTLPAATDVLIAYFTKSFSKNAGRLSDYNMTNINDAKNTEDAVGAAYNANAGWGKSKAQLLLDPTGGRRRALSIVDDFYALTSAGGSAPDPDPVISDEIISTGTITAGRLNMRKGPGTNYPANGVLNRDATVNIYESREGWHRIDMSNHWISGKYVKVNAIVAEPDPVVDPIPVVDPVPVVDPIPTSDLPIRFHASGTAAHADKLQAYLNQFDGIRLNVDGQPGKLTSAAFKTVMGSYLLGDPRNS